MSVSALRWMGRELRREVVVDRRAVAVLGVSATVICLCLSGAFARFYGPWGPVPMTFQTLFVLLAGAAMGPGLGTLSTSAYVALGSAGLPVFTEAWGGHTTGYLVGFIAAGALIGGIVRRSPRPSALRLGVAMALGTLAIYACGATVLALHFRLGPAKAIQFGVLPFLAGDALKLAAALAFCRACRDRLRTLFP